MWWCPLGFLILVFNSWNSSCNSSGTPQIIITRQGLLGLIKTQLRGEWMYHSGWAGTSLETALLQKSDPKCCGNNQQGAGDHKPSTHTKHISMSSPGILPLCKNLHSSCSRMFTLNIFPFGFEVHLRKC